MAAPTRRQALYFPAEMLAELQVQALRQDRSISWLIQQAWRLSHVELQRLPGTEAYQKRPGAPHPGASAGWSKGPEPERSGD